jgi:hypothetical protein
MQALKLGFARRVLGDLNPVGAGQPVVRKGHAHVWQRRFYDFNVRTERKRIEKLRYIHRNPVTRDLVKEPGQWPWSSFRSYTSHEARPVKINDWQLLQMKIQHAPDLDSK